MIEREPISIPIVSEKGPELEVADAKIDLRSYLIKKGFSDLVTIRLVEKLIKEGKLSIEIVPEIVQSAENQGTSLVNQLIFKGLTDERELTEVLAAINDIEPVSLSDDIIHEGEAFLFDFAQASKFNALPYGRDQFGNLLVAISDPENIAIREDVQRKLPEESIKFTLAGANELGILIEKIYNPVGSGKISDLVLEAEEEDESSSLETIHARETDYSAPVIRLVDEIIKGAVDVGASDIHIESREKNALVRYRVDSLLRDVKPIQKNLEAKVISRIKNIANMKPDERRIPQDGRVSLNVEDRKIDLRVATLPVVHGEQATMRLLDVRQAMVGLDELGMSKGNIDRYLDSIRKPHGCCFITGPTGSGKSTTLYASLNQTRDSQKKIMTLEDPVEYRLEGISQTDLSGGARSGDNKMSFATVLKSILRSDPDIIMVGEIRDEETARIAIDASLTGHFLYSTLHTNDALSSIARLERMGVERFLIAAATEVIVAQRLIRKLCRCKIQAGPDPINSNETVFSPDFKNKALSSGLAAGSIFKPSPSGCPDCAGTGYKGRTAVHEVITMTPEIKSAVELGASLEEMEALARSQGFGSLLDDAFLRVLEGTTSLEEVARVVL